MLHRAVTKNQLHHEGHEEHEEVFENIFITLRALRALRGEFLLPCQESPA
jgi:hypothetical protein